MATKKQHIPTPVFIDARIACLKKPYCDWMYYIVIRHRGQDFKSDVPYKYHGNAVRFAKKMGFNVIEG